MDTNVNHCKDFSFVVERKLTKTATLEERFETRKVPSASMKVDFPTPGGPEMPIRKVSLGKERKGKKKQRKEEN
jgi:hypothetical protein